LGAAPQDEVVCESLINKTGTSSSSPMTAEGRLAAGDAHMAAHGRRRMATIDDEIVPFGLACNRLGDGLVEEFVALRRAQGRAQVGGVLLAQAHVERAGAGQPYAVAALAKVMGQRRDETQAPVVPSDRE